MTESIHRLRSAHLGNERTIWIRPPADGRPARRLVVFLDAELYREKVDAVEVIEGSEADPAIPPALYVFVSYATMEARWIECPCHPPFARFIAEEFMPWLQGLHPEVATCAQRVLVGLSYTGLAAAYVALQAPGLFTHVIAQSGSFWSADGWLIEQYRQASGPFAEFYLDVGTKEDQEDVEHKEDLIQEMSQIEGVTRFRDVLIAKGVSPRYVMFEGGHDCAAWKRTLPGALRWALV